MLWMGDKAGACYFPRFGGPFFLGSAGEQHAPVLCQHSQPPALTLWFSLGLGGAWVSLGWVYGWFSWA